MTDILFVDDVKEPRHYGLMVENITVARTAESAWRKIRKRSVNNPIHELWLDHDLGDGMNGYELLKKMVEGGMAPQKVICISWNIVGVQRIKDYCHDNGIPYERGIDNLESIGS